MESKFSAGVLLNENEKEYQSALHEYRDGLVVSLKVGRQGLFTVHRAECPTLSYDLKAAGHSKRSGKLLFRNRAELDGYSGLNELGKLNWFCAECPR